MPEENVILLVENPELTDDLVTQLHRIGFDHVTGWLPTVDLPQVDPSLLASIPSIRSDRLEDFLSNRPGAVIVDVRRSDEYREGHLLDALNIPHTRLRAKASAVPEVVPLVVHCKSGLRATFASALLAHLGHDVTCVNDTFGNAPPEMIVS